MSENKLGLYKHFKGNLYELIDLAKHSETLEDMVIYRALYGERKLWVRPLSMWNETVTVDGKPTKRFEYLQAKTQEETEILFENDAVKVERIRSYGVASPLDFWYDNDVDEYVMLQKGNAVLEFQQEKVSLKADESYYIKAHSKHRVDFSSADCEWLCIYIK